MNKQNSFTEGSIGSPLIRFALPVLAALLLQAMYGAVDLWVVGKYATAADVSGVSTGSQLMSSVTFLVVGLSMGITITVGQKIGEGRPEEAGHFIGGGICLFSVISVVMTLILVPCSGLLTQIMHAPVEAVSQTTDYIRICSFGFVFIVAYNLLGSIFRGIGDSKMPLFTVAISCVLNIGGDLLLVAVFDMGAAGAALATVVSQAVSVLLSALIIRRRSLPFHFTKSHIRFDRKIIGRIISLGAPIALQDLLVSASFLIILAIVNSIGLVASAGLGVAEKLCTFIMLVPSAYMQSMSAFVAQNIGAGKPERARKALGIGITSSLAVGILMAWLAFFHGDMLAGLFIKAEELEVIAAAWDYLKAYAIDCLLTSFLFCLMGYFNGSGKTLFVMLQGIVGAFVIRVPVSYFVSRATSSLFLIGLATPISSVVQILLCGIYFLRMNKKHPALER